MFEIKTAKSFILSRMFGLLLIIIAFILIFSLFTYSENTVIIGSTDTSIKNQGLVSFYTSYISGIMILFFNYSSALIPAFFLITGIKSIIGIKYHNFIFQASVLLVGLFFLNLLLTFANISQSLIGSFLMDVFNTYEWFKNIYFKNSIAQSVHTI